MTRRAHTIIAIALWLALAVVLVLALTGKLEAQELTPRVWLPLVVRQSGPTSIELVTHRAVIGVGEMAFVELWAYNVNTTRWRAQLWWTSPEFGAVKSPIMELLERGQAKGDNRMPSYGAFRDIGHYLQSRAHDHDTNLTAISEQLEWGRSYLNSVAQEQFRPSMERCRQIAAYFDDKPDIILTLAGYMEPPPRENETSAAIASVVSTLPPRLQHMMLHLAEFLKARESMHVFDDLAENQLYVELPDGRSFTLRLDAPTDAVDESLLRVTLRAALNATLARA